MTSAPDQRELRSAFGQFATGVTIVTCKTPHGVHGMTANSFTSVSLDPPILLICIATTARMNGVLAECDGFGLSVLHRGQQSVSDHFARSGNTAPFTFDTLEGVPVIGDALAQFACSVDASHPAGDHRIYLGRIGHYDFRPGQPLMYHGGSYLDVPA